MYFNQPQYAGFWARFAASLIDSILIGIVKSIIGFILFPILIGFNFFDEFNGNMHFTGYEDYYYEDQFADFFFIFLGFMVIFTIISIIIDWLYFALMESSSKQATVGKMVLNIKVTDEMGNRISFARASGRYFGKILSSLILMIGYIMAAFTQKKQALHDILSNCLVVKNVININQFQMQDPNSFNNYNNINNLNNPNNNTNL